MAGLYNIEYLSLRLALERRTICCLHLSWYAEKKNSTQRRFLMNSKYAFILLISSLATATQDQIKGCILGAAVGDALGRVTEFIDTTDGIHKKYGSKGVTSFASFKKRDWIDGKAAYTDDTLLSKALLEEGLKTTDPEELLQNYAQRLKHIYGPNKYTIDPWYDIRAHGPTCIQAAPWLNLGKISLSHLLHREYLSHQKEGGCGSVMRAWPIGIIYDKDKKNLKQVADAQSCLTHRHPMARAASVALASGIADALNGTSPLKIVDGMIQAAEEYKELEKFYKTDAIDPHGKYSPKQIAQNQLLTGDMLRYAKTMTGRTPEEILGTNNNKGKNYRSPSGFLIGWAADEALAAAVYVFLRHPNYLRAAVIEAANTPGDSDSIATLAGALVGAHSGWATFEKDGFDISALENKKELEQLAKPAVSSLERIQGNYIHLLEDMLQEASQAKSMQEKQHLIYEMQAAIKAYKFDYRK